MLTLVTLALRNLFQNKIRILMSVGGVALALTLIFALDAVFTGAERQITAYIDRSEADVWVAQEGVRNLHMVSSWLPSSVTGEIEAVQGVDSVTPIMYVTGMIDTGRERNLAYIIGLPSDAKMGRAWRLKEGAALPSVGETVIDRSVAANSGLNLGDKVNILGQELKIAGISEGTANITNSVAFISMADFERARGGTQAVSFVLVKGKGKVGATPEDLAARIEREVGGVSALSRREFAEQERSLVKDMATDVLTIMNLVGIVIGLAVLALTVYTATLSRRAEYGVLKAVGARNGSLNSVVLAQALVSVAFGFLFGLIFTWLIALAMPALGSSVSLELSGDSMFKVGVASLVIAGLSSLLPVLQIARLDPAVVFRRKVQ